MNSLNARLLLLSLLLPCSVFAQSNTPIVDVRQEKQEARIEQGEKSGSLTSREANRLERGQTRLDRIETRAKSDGMVSQAERARLQRAENRQSREIRREKKDRQHDFNHDGQQDRRHRSRQ